MKKHITESRVLYIEDKVFSLEHVRALAAILWEEQERMIKAIEADIERDRGSAPPLEFASPTVRFYVECFDESAFSSEDISIFDDDSIINRKRVKKIELKYEGGFESMDSIKVELEHHDENKGSVKITGDDNIWVNGMITRFDDVIEAVPNQEAFWLEHQINLAIFFSLFGAALAILLLLSPENKQLSGFEWIVAVLTEEIGGVIIIGGIGALFGFFFAGFISERAQKAWPTIELQMGPDHFHMERKKRNFWAWLAGAFIIPLAISIFTGWIS